MRPLAQSARAAAKGSEWDSAPREEEAAADRFLRGVGRSKWERIGGGSGRSGLGTEDSGDDVSLGMPGRCSQENGTAKEGGAGDKEPWKGRRRAREEMCEERESSFDPPSVVAGGAPSIAVVIVHLCRGESVIYRVENLISIEK